MSQHCERSWEIDAYFDDLLGEKEKASLDRHLETCAVCIDAKEQAEHLRALGEALPRPEPSELRLRRMRARILRAVALGEAGARSPLRKRALGVGAFVVMAASALAIGFGRSSAPAPLSVTTSPNAPSNVAAPPPPSPELAGTVRPEEGAAWRQTREGAIERVTLTDGLLHIHVRHQNADERFFVDLPDGTVEVRGTTFDVEARDGHAEHVAVDEGVVAWRPSGESEILLRAGDAWSSSPRARSSASAAPSAKPAAIAARPSSSGATDDGAADYANAMTLYRTGDVVAAADAFASYVAAHPHGSDAEDASYLRAVALARANRMDDAVHAAAVHLSAYPGSFHRKEASILIARSARDHGDCAKAAAILAPWLGASPDPEAIATLRSCETAR